MNIPDGVFINTIAQIYRRNAAIGLWIQMVVTSNNVEGDISLAIKKMIFPNETQSKLPVRDSVKVINKIKNIDTVEYISSQQDATIDISKLMREAALYYHSQLKSNSKASIAIDILHSWGIKGKTIVQLGIGFHDNSFNSFMNYMIKQKSYLITQLEEAKLVLQSAKGNYYDKMRNSIIIPTIDANGNVVCFDFYITNKQQLFKYPNTKYFERSQNLYSYNLAIKSKEIPHKSEY